MDTPTGRKADVIQIRASRTTKALLQHAAELRRQNLSEFMLESAVARAEATLLDARLFALDADAFARFIDLLDHPPVPTEDIVDRYRRPAPWA